MQFKKYQDLSKAIISIENEVFVLYIYNNEVLTYNLQPNISYNVYYDLNQMFLRHKYHVLRFLYHAKRFISILNEFETPTDINDENEYLIPFNNDSIFYEFDSFIETAASLFEAPFKNEALKYFSKKQKDEFNSIFPKSQDPDCLYWEIYWRLKIIRNRVVHPDNPFYFKGGRISESSSKGGNIAKVKDGKIVEIKANLIDISNNPKYIEILKKDVIDKNKNVKKEFEENTKKFDTPHNSKPQLTGFEEAIFKNQFNMTKREQKEAPLLIHGSMNLLESFSSILDSLISYVHKLNQIYLNQFAEELGNLFKNIMIPIDEDGLFRGSYSYVKNLDTDMDYISIEDMFQIR